MKKLLLFILVSITLSGCSIFQIHRMDVDQGNVYTDDQVAKLQNGLTTGQVKTIMGNPVLVNVFTPHYIEYVYTFKTGNAPMNVKRVACKFRNGVLVDVVRS